VWRQVLPYNTGIRNFLSRAVGICFIIPTRVRVATPGVRGSSPLPFRHPSEGGEYSQDICLSISKP